MAAVRIDESQIFVLAARLAALPEIQGEFSSQAVQAAGLRGLALVKRNASGRPGPRVRTGDYRRSLNMRFTAAGFHGEGGSGRHPTAFIGTNAPQAQRLEEGFVGTDAIGRRYNQPPYPHFRPMAEQIQSEWDSIMQGVVAAAIRGSKL